MVLVEAINMMIKAKINSEAHMLNIILRKSTKSFSRNQLLLRCYTTVLHYLLLQSAPTPQIGGAMKPPIFFKFAQ